jgi:hypothetical protein
MGKSSWHWRYSRRALGVTFGAGYIIHMAVETSPTRPYHYRDFPELFWDAKPEAVIELDNPFVLSRVLQKGSLEHVRKLVDFNILRAKWGELWLPERTRYVWGKVLDIMPQVR